jgi:GNAT superfamily N-acetyltransferase
LDTALPVRFEAALPADAPALAALHTSVAQHLTARHGEGHWSGRTTEKGVLFSMRSSNVHVARSDTHLVATFALATRKPWAIDIRYFQPATRPLYLVNMAVAPDLQRQGLGRLCIQDAIRLARSRPADALRLDAYDAAAGAGPFYARTGFREVGRTSYKLTPLIYFEMQL